MKKFAEKFGQLKTTLSLKDLVDIANAEVPGYSVVFANLPPGVGGVHVHKRKLIGLSPYYAGNPGVVFHEMGHKRVGIGRILHPLSHLSKRKLFSPYAAVLSPSGVHRDVAAIASGGAVLEEARAGLHALRIAKKYGYVMKPVLYSNLRNLGIRSRWIPLYALRRWREKSLDAAAKKMGTKRTFLERAFSLPAAARKKTRT